MINTLKWLKILIFSFLSITVITAKNDIDLLMRNDTSKTELEEYYTRPSSYSINFSAFNDKAGTVVIQSQTLIFNHVSYTPIKYVAVGAGAQFFDDNAPFFFVKPSLPISKNIAIGAMAMGYLVEVYENNELKKAVRFTLIPQLTLRSKIIEYSASYFPKDYFINSLRLNLSKKSWLGFEAIFVREFNINGINFTYNLNRKNFNWGLGAQLFAGYEFVLPLPIINCRYSF
ncbi:MAG: hypothetical protein RLZZ546_315 [Bacteroidota bacterium]|jgi:hypothetical protein